MCIRDRVKAAFMDKELNEHLSLTSANSINVARFLPQAFYYFYAYAQLTVSYTHLDVYKRQRMLCEIQTI